MIKTLLLFAATAFCCFVSSAQSNNAIETLDDYFAGVPLKEGFDKWARHLMADPLIGLDSFNERGIYSSFKPGIKTHFPFPDSIKVKILVTKVVYYDSITKKSFDSTSEISMEAVFENNKAGKKASIAVFKKLRKGLGKHYDREDMSSSGTLWFTRGRTQEFLNCYLLQDHADDLGFYFVMLNYTSPRKHPPLVQ